ncbi:TPA: hypothetical protein QDA98_003901 [Burkholderia vietnamiensis]|nr:hypothetical protein [Burkholderia vietnamiensis]
MIDQDKMRALAIKVGAVEWYEAGDSVCLPDGDTIACCQSSIIDALEATEREKEKLRAELESAAANERDAERYRYLRSRPESVEPDRIDVVYWSALDESANEGEGLRGDALDAAIDAALAQRQGEGS